VFFLNDSKEITKKCQKKKTLTCLHGQTHIFFLYFYQRLFAFISRQKWVFVVCLIWTPSLLFFCQRFSLYSSFFLMDVWHFFVLFCFSRKKEIYLKVLSPLLLLFNNPAFCKEGSIHRYTTTRTMLLPFSSFLNFSISALTSTSDSFLFRENPWDVPESWLSSRQLIQTSNFRSVGSFNRLSNRWAS
jgi:hypothetical protein